MEAYVLFARGKEEEEEVISRFEEQEEDIGCPSEPSALHSTSSSSDGVDLADDASSSGSNSHFEMASLMTHLPIKYVLMRGQPVAHCFRLSNILVLAGCGAVNL